MLTLFHCLCLTSPVQFITMKTTEIQASFAAILETFEPIIGQPTDEDLTCLEFSTLGVLAPISFDE